MNIIKQAFVQMRTQPLISAITIIGTALAIFLIMIVVMLQEVLVEPYAPESNRDRFLHVQYMSIFHKDWGDGSSNGPMSWTTAKDCFKSMTTPEAVTVYVVNEESQPLQLPGQPSISADVRKTDADYFRVFDFSFIDGKPFDQATFDAGLPVAVISESIARSLFGTTEVTGREFLLSHAPYRVAGVVKDVSTLATQAYAQVWIPFSSTAACEYTWCDNHMGSFSVTILAHDRNEFPAVREEADRLLNAWNAAHEEAGWYFVSRNRPYDQEKFVISVGANNEPDVDAARRSRLIVYIILLIVPAINLSSMTQSRLRQRITEIGVRRAFGATRSGIIGQLIVENFAVTLIAGILGFLLSVCFAFIFSNSLFSLEYAQTLNPPHIDLTILLHPSTFMMALLFCFILNLLSSGIPAWRASRTNVVDAINNHSK